MSCEQACCKCYVYDSKEKNDMSKTCMSCKTNCNQTTYDGLNSEITIKNRLVKTGIDIKTAYSHLDITATYSMVEDIGMFESLKKEIEKIKFPL